MAKAPPWEPPPDPDFQKLAHDGYAMWQADRPNLLAFDTETTGLTYFDTAFCVTAAWERPTGEIVGHYFELEKFDSTDMVCEILSNGTLIGHNLKFDLQKAVLAELLPRYLTPHEIEDTQILAHLVNEHGDHGLKELMVSLCGWDDTMTVEIKSGPNKGQTKEVVREKHIIQEARRKLKLKKEDGYDKIPRGLVVPYAITDAVGTMQLYRALKPQVERHEDLRALYRQEMELTLVLLTMEDAGLAVVIDYVNEKVKEYTKRVLKHDMKIQQIVGRPVGKDKDAGEFNPASPDQLKELFTSLGFARDSYDEDNLKSIDHPLAAALLERRSDSKILTTYLRPIQNEQRDLVLHPSYRQNVSTGRMSSGSQKGD